MNVFEKLSTKDVINHYCSKFDDLDIEKKEILSNLMVERICNSNVVELVELYSDIKLETEILEEKTNKFQSEIVSINKKIETYENLEQFASNQGLSRERALLKLINEIEKRESKKTKLQLKLRILSSINIHIDSSIIEKINNLSHREISNVKHQFTTKLEIIQEKINILNLEITSKKDKISNFDNFKETTKIQELERLKSLIELSAKLYDNEFQKQHLENFVNVYHDKYSSKLNSKTKKL